MGRLGFPPDLNLLVLVPAGDFLQPDVINQWVVNLKFELEAGLAVSMAAVEKARPKDYQEGMWKYLVE